MVSFKVIATILLSTAVAIAAGGGDAIITPASGQVINANDKVDITWNPDPTITAINLVLRGGDQSALSTLYTIASTVGNTGTYSWTVPGNTASATDYVIEIQNAANTSEANYSPYFTILAAGQGWTSSSSDISTSADPSSAPASAQSSGSPGSSVGSSAVATSQASAAAASTSGSSSATTTHTVSATASTAAGFAIQPSNAILALGAIAAAGVFAFN